MLNLKEKFKSSAIPYAEKIKDIVKKYPDVVIDKVTLGQLYGGMRDVISLATETSLLDSNKGIAFRGFSIDDIYARLPKSPIGSSEPTPELVFHLLLTGVIPSTEEIASLSKEWHARAAIPAHVFSVIDSFPHTTHPMVLLSTAVSAMETESIFNREYPRSKKTAYWEHTYEDAMNIIASLPTIVAYIHNRLYTGSKAGDIPEGNTSLDWAGNMAYMMGYKDPSVHCSIKEFLRLHMFLHSDHEGGNASAGTAHVVGSTLASPYASLASAFHSLSGPLHGLAAQNALEWIKTLSQKYHGKPTQGQIEDYIRDALANGSVVPGYGHAVLRQTDPRFTAQMNFAKKCGFSDDLLETVWNVYAVAPKILGEMGKIKNPYPNVDAHSGVVLNHLGFNHPGFYTVLFGASRTLGVMAQQIWDRLFGHPLHRPKSVTSEWIINSFKDEFK